jgi:energy-coupling factor transporter ATP-binding protein EcfA2
VTIRAEYQRFLESLGQQNAPEDIRRVANVILAHLDALATVGATRRARSTRLVPILNNEFANAPVQLPQFPQMAQNGQNLGRLDRLTVGPFRGFMRQEVFDLSHDITLVYGANGTGKSSFCEALEAALLGSIGEARVKRLDQRAYSNNARLRRHEIPALTSTLPTGEVAAVRQDESAFRFCFIEKNRLDDFARIAARTPADQRQLIATLFGIEEFSEFVRGFNPSLDENLALAPVQAQALQQRRMQLAASEQAINTFPERTAQIQVQEQQLANRIHPGGPSFQDCCQWLMGTQAQIGRLPFVQGQLDAVPPTVYEVFQAKLAHLLSEAYRINALLLSESGELAKRAGEISFSQLYRAVLELSEGANACPACGTPLNAVAQNPFERAKAGLQQLAELATIQAREAGLRIELTEALRVLWEEVRKVIQLSDVHLHAQYQAAQLPPLAPANLPWLGTWVDGDQRPWLSLLALSAQLEQLDVAARAVHAQRGELVQERIRLDAFRIEIERLNTAKVNAQTEFAQAQQLVVQFEIANQGLIAAAGHEVQVIAFQQRIKAAYDGFLRALQGYFAALPGRLLQGLGERAKALYNAFNREDPQGDLLHALHLPVAENGKIEIEFVGEPGVRFDALILLSEGHIKCLGLAILLAKNISQSCSIVIFDDVVNAIDDEHRDGIWRTFFEDGLLDGKQIILTSHAEEFLHRIQQELGAARAGAIKRYKFLPHSGEHELRVDGDPPIKNYVLLAQEALTRDEKREALRHSRPALESLTDRIWVWLGRHGEGRIDIKLPGPRSPWELNNKCTKIRSAVNRVAAQFAGAPAVVSALDILIGVNGGSIEWGYLNSGVHDAQRDHEFDRATVTRIVQAMVQLDINLAAMLTQR